MRGERALSFWIPGLLVVVLVGGLAMAGQLQLGEVGLAEPDEHAELAPLWVDPARTRVGRVPDWADPRWVESVRAVLARHAPFALAESDALASLRAGLEALSFVRRVPRCEASPEDGLVVELVLRMPVACIPLGGEFALVADDGTVLEGRWPLPPRLGSAFLPVIGPLHDELLERARAGDWLVEPEHVDALDVALSMAEHLSHDERAALGRVLVDGRSARRASVAEPGVRLELEGARLALFGRAPSAGEPGELSAAAKWRSLVRAVELYARDPQANDWQLVDLRWDRPDLGWREPIVVAAALEPALSSRVDRSGVRDVGSAALGVRDASRSRVR